MARPKTGKTRINLYVPDNVLSAYKTLAQRRGTTYSELARNALREYIRREITREKAGRSG
jgi:hypothetical protein